jgi:uncharacterized membrane protein SpoIIM required for sporulation
MIIDLKKFIDEERPFWNEFEALLVKVGNNPEHRMSLDGVKRFHYLYQRTSADLARIGTFSAEPNTRQYLESLVSRAYAEIHENRAKPHRWRPLHWFFFVFPVVFRRNINAFWLCCAAMLVGCAFGAFLLMVAPDTKAFLLPFAHLHGDPAERVAKEEQADEDQLAGSKIYFSSHLMTHNTKVAVFTFCLGITWGIGTLIMLFYNGIILGAVAYDYVLAGQTEFLLGWLLPHGSIEIPAILPAGQAGLVLAGALIGRQQSIPLRMRFRNITGDMVTLVFGVALMLVWAGIIEAFFSQYHEPVLPYGLKIGFGLTELVLLTYFLGRSGRKRELE